jgi:hypothetical protein
MPAAAVVTSDLIMITTRDNEGSMSSPYVSAQCRSTSGLLSSMVDVSKENMCCIHEYNFHTLLAGL